MSTEAELGIDFKKKKTKKKASKSTLKNIYEDAEKLFDLKSKIKNKRKRKVNAEKEKKKKIKSTLSKSDIIDKLKNTIEKIKKASQQGSYWGGEQSQNEDGSSEKKEKSYNFEDIRKKEDYNKFQEKERDYYYPELLDRIFGLLYKKNPNYAETSKKKRMSVRTPQIFKDGPKKSVFVNFPDICQDLNRTKEHVMQYFFAELGTTGTLDSEDRLTFRSVFRGGHIEKVLHKYVLEYVICKLCESSDTLLKRDANTRLYSIVCNKCNASRTVEAVKKGYVANFVPRRHR